MSPKIGYRPDIDGLRGVAVLLVVLYHGGLGVTGGYVGVDVFFAISGYLIMRLMLKEMADGSISLAQFWERRIRRILPALLAMTLVTLVVSTMVLLPLHFKAVGKAMAAQAMILSNLAFWDNAVRFNLGYFVSETEKMPLLHTWSLAVEEQFYLILPLLVIWICWQGKASREAQKKQKLIVSLMILTGLSFLASATTLGFSKETAFYWLPTRAWELLMGCVLACLPSNHPWMNILNRGWSGWIGLALILVCALAYDNATLFPGLAAFPVCFGTCLIIGNHASPGTGQKGVARLLAWKPLVTIGLISYSLYLWHWPVFALNKYLWVSTTAPALRARIGLVLLSILLAYLSWRWIETPTREKRLIQHRKGIYIFAFVTTLILFSMGLSIWLNRGYPQRFNERTTRLFHSAEFEKGNHWWLQEKQLELVSLPKFGAENSSSPPQLLLWGDSHAHSLLPVLDELAREYHQTGLCAVYGGLSPTLNFYDGCPREHAEVMQRVGEVVLREVCQGHVRNILITANWSRRHLLKSQPFVDALLHTVRELKAAGADVWIMLDVPEHSFDVLRALVFHAQWPTLFPDPRPLATRMEAHLERNVVMQTLVPELKTLGVHVLDPTSKFFDDNGQAILERDGEALYFDEHHLSGAGSRMLRDMLRGIFDDSENSS